MEYHNFDTDDSGSEVASTRSSPSLQMEAGSQMARQLSSSQDVNTEMNLMAPTSSWLETHPPSSSRLSTSNSGFTTYDTSVDEMRSSIRILPDDAATPATVIDSVWWTNHFGMPPLKQMEGEAGKNRRTSELDEPLERFPRQVAERVLMA
jgi:hypothetical protein